MKTFTELYGALLVKIIIGLSVLVGLFLLIAVFSEFKSYRYIGSGLPSSNTITVTGQGKVDKAPDTARFTFTVQNQAKDVATAQDAVSKKVATVKADLLTIGVADADISTESYNSYPEYDYPQSMCANGSCTKPGGPVLRDYQVSQAVTVKVKKLDTIGTVVGVLGKDAVTDMQGPNFGFDDDKAVSREARDLAIADAKDQAQKLASSLGVKLVRIVSFNDQSSGGQPVPMYNKLMATDSMASAAAPTIPTGVQEISSNVTITYEIR